MSTETTIPEPSITPFTNTGPHTIRPDGVIFEEIPSRPTVSVCCVTAVEGRLACKRRLSMGTGLPHEALTVVSWVNTAQSFVLVPSRGYTVAFMDKH